MVTRGAARTGGAARGAGALCAVAAGRWGACAGGGGR